VNDRKDDDRLTKNQAISLTLLSSLMFSTSYVAIKIGLEDIDPFLFEAAIIAIGALIAFIYTLYRKTFTMRIFRHWEVWAASAIGLVSISLQFVGLTTTTASKGALIIGSTVIFVAPLAALLFREKFTGAKAFGILIGVFGLITLTTQWSPEAFSSGEFAGDLLLLGSAATGAIVWALTRKGLRKLRYDQWMLSLHAIYPIPIILISYLFGDIENVSWNALPAVVYLGIFCTSIPAMLWAKGLGAISLTVSATIILSESVFGTVLGRLILGDELGMIGVIGAIMVFAAIYVVSRGEDPRKTES